MRSIRFCALGLIILAMLVAGCVPVSAAPAPLLVGQVAATPQPTPRPSDFPRGRFSATTAPNMVLLAIHNDGSYQIFVDNDLLDSGQFEMLGAQVSVQSQACAYHGNRPAVYAWSYDVELGLAFQPLGADPCPERQQYFSDSYMPKYSFVYIIPDRGVSREWLW